MNTATQGIRCGSGFRGRVRAFTLMEVMIAVAIFFSVVMIILGLVSQNLRAARSLARPRLDMGMLASQLALTNRLEEGPLSGGDFGDVYPGVSWSGNIVLAPTNGMFRVDFVAVDHNAHGAQSYLSIFLYRPDSTAGQGVPGIKR